jgi:hypothetical protein
MAKRVNNIPPGLPPYTVSAELMVEEGERALWASFSGLKNEALR